MTLTHGISARLNLWFVTIITILLGLSGTYNYYVTKAEFEQRLNEEIGASLARLQQSTPSTLWNFDKKQLEQTLRSEMTSSAMVAVVITGDSGFIAGVARDQANAVEAITANRKFEDASKSAELMYKDGDKLTKVGTATTYFSVAGIQASLRAGIIRLLVQIIVLDTVIVLALSRVVFTTVLKPLYRVRMALQDIAQGDADLTRRLDDQRPDEFGEVARWFNVFATRIQSVMARVAESAAQLATAAEQTSQITEQTNYHVKTQTTAISEVASAIDDMQGQVYSISHNAAEAMAAATAAEQTADEGKRIIYATGDAINALADEVVMASKVIEQLDEDSQKIRSVLNVISEIAQQTNLLALNAAIEAARAGEQGRGFAVVADEVRKLATRTAESTGEIQDVIAQLLSGSREAVRVMLQSRERAGAGSAQAIAAGESVDRIYAAVQRIRTLNQAIEALAGSQNRLVDGVSVNIHTIEKVIAETASGAEQTAIASDEQAKQAVSLQTLVDQFKI